MSACPEFKRFKKVWYVLDDRIEDMGNNLDEWFIMALIQLTY